MRVREGLKEERKKEGVKLGAGWAKVNYGCYYGANSK
jgi:hypothetical protein